jgi:hypothetical protein
MLQMTKQNEFEIYKSKDSRIKFCANDKNIGGPSNYNKVFHLSSGEFFKWSAYDDVLAPQFLEKCVSALDRDKTLIGCYTKTARIDENGHFLGYYNEGLLKNTDSVKPRTVQLTSLNINQLHFMGYTAEVILRKVNFMGVILVLTEILLLSLVLLGVCIKFLNAYSIGESIRMLIHRFFMVRIRKTHQIVF